MLLDTDKLCEVDAKSAFENNSPPLYLCPVAIISVVTCDSQKVNTLIQSCCCVFEALVNRKCQVKNNRSLGEISVLILLVNVFDGLLSTLPFLLTLHILSVHTFSEIHTTNGHLWLPISRPKKKNHFLCPQYE